MPKRQRKPKKISTCDFCDYKSPRKRDVARHMLTHTGEKPYPCRYCSKRFAASDNCTRHERIHTGEKPYTCSACGKSFNQICNTKTHILYVHSGLGEVNTTTKVEQLTDGHTVTSTTHSVETKTETTVVSQVISSNGSKALVRTVKETAAPYTTHTTVLQDDQTTIVDIDMSGLTPLEILAEVALANAGLTVNKPQD